MKEGAEKLLQKMIDDKVFAETLLKQNDVEKVIELAAEEKIRITREDIDEVNEAIRQVIERSQAEGELSEEELENVAGGTYLISLLATITSALVTAATSFSISLTATLFTASTE